MFGGDGYASATPVTVSLGATTLGSSRCSDGSAPAAVEGTRVSSCIKVKGFRNIVHWEVARYDEPKSIELQGRGRGGHL
jgi:hypothetical protein